MTTTWHCLHCCVYIPLHFIYSSWYRNSSNRCRQYLSKPDYTSYLINQKLSVQSDTSSTRYCQNQPKPEAVSTYLNQMILVTGTSSTRCCQYLCKPDTSYLPKPDAVSTYLSPMISVDQLMSWPPYWGHLLNHAPIKDVRMKSKPNNLLHLLSGHCDNKWYSSSISARVHLLRITPASLQLKQCMTYRPD